MQFKDIQVDKVFEFRGYRYKKLPDDTIGGLNGRAVVISDVTNDIFCFYPEEEVEYSR